MPPSSQRVWMKPGHTVLTRTAGENQRARVKVNVLSAPLEQA
jgi:hypothetical protein